MKQIGGDHYSKHKFDIFDISDEYNLGPREHTIIKYILRHKDKGGIQDLKKAKSVLDGLIELLEGQSLKECVDGACAMPKTLDEAIGESGGKGFTAFNEKVY